MFKKSVESSSILFKLLIASIIAIFVSYVGFKTILYFKSVNELKKEASFIQDFKLFLDSKSEEKIFKIPLIKKDLLLICFSNSLSEMELNNRFKINTIFDSSVFFRNNMNNLNLEAIENFMKDGQYDVYFIYKSGEWKGYKIGNLIFPDYYPYCFKVGDELVKKKVYGLYTIKKRGTRNLIDYI